MEETINKKTIDAFLNNLTEQEKNNMIKRFIQKQDNKRRKDSKKPKLEEISYLQDVKGLTTKEVATIYRVKPGTIRVWRHQARKGEY